MHHDIPFLLMKKAVAGIMRNQVKVDATTDHVCNTLTHISALYLEKLALYIKNYAELSGRANVCLEDVLNIFEDWGLNVDELSEEQIIPYDKIQPNGFNQYSSNFVNTPSSPISVYEIHDHDTNIEPDHFDTKHDENIDHPSSNESELDDYFNYMAHLKLNEPTHEEYFMRSLPVKPEKIEPSKEIDSEVSLNTASSLPTVVSNSNRSRKQNRIEVEDISKPLETDSMHAIKRLSNKRLKLQSTVEITFNDIVNHHDQAFLKMLTELKAKDELHEVERKNPLMGMDIDINQSQSNPDTHGLPYLPFFSPIDVLFHQNVPSVTQSDFVSSVVPPMSRNEFLTVGTIPQPTWLQPSQPLSSPPAPPTPVKKSNRKSIGHAFTSGSPAPKIKFTFKNSTSPSEHDTRSQNDQPYDQPNIDLLESPHRSNPKSVFPIIIHNQTDDIPSLPYQNGTSSERINCICQKPDFDDGLFMISCDKCLEWFHGHCVDVFPHQELNSWYCPRCINRKKEKAKRKAL